MPPVILQPNVPLELDTPTLEVAPGLPPGEYRIQLEVINKQQVRSRPVSATVTVVKQ